MKDWVETREDLIGRLRLAGYELTKKPSGWNPTMICKWGPDVQLLWLNGCRVKGAAKFLTFTEAWEYILERINEKG